MKPAIFSTLPSLRPARRRFGWRGGAAARFLTGLAAGAVLGAVNLPASAAPSTWTGSGNWSTSGNWSAGIPGSTASPFTSTDLAIFSGTSASLAPNLDASYNVGSVMFGATAVSGDFTLSATNGSSLILSGVSANPTAATATSAGGNQIVNNTGTPATSGAHYETINAPIILENTSGTSAGSGLFFFAANGGSTDSPNTSSFLKITGSVTGMASTGNTSTLTLYGGNNTRGLGGNEVSGIISDGANGGALAVAFQQGNQFGTNGSTTWILSGANTYSGGTLINTNGFNGTLQVNNSAALGTGVVTWTASGGNNNDLLFGAANLNLANNMTLNTTAVFDTGSNSATLSGILSGTGRLQKNNGNTLTLTGANNYSGGTLVNGGTLAVTGNTASAFGTGTVTLASGAALNLAVPNGNTVITYANNFAFGANQIYSYDGDVHLGNATSTVAVTGATTLNRQYGHGDTRKKLSIDGILTGTGALTLNAIGNPYNEGAGVLIGNNANTYSGTITVNSASGNGMALIDGGNSALQYATVDVEGNGNGDTPYGLRFNPGVTAPVLGALQGNGRIVLQDLSGIPAAVALTAGGSGASTSYSGVLSGVGSFTKAGTGTTTFTAANTYTGGTMLMAGVLAAGSNSALGTGSVTLNGGKLTASGSGFTVSTGTGTLKLTASSILDFGMANTGNIFQFAGSSGNPFTGTLSVYDWNGSSAGGGLDQFFVGTDSTGLTAMQLSQIAFYSDSGQTLLGSAGILSTGEVVALAAAPEPSAWAALLMGTLGLGVLSLKARRRAA